MMADPRLRHHGDGHGLLDPRIIADRTCGRRRRHGRMSDGNALERHDGDGAGVLGDLAFVGG
jgi:hypothetical protein